MKLQEVLLLLFQGLHKRFVRNIFLKSFRNVNIASKIVPHLELDENFVAVHCQSAEFSMLSIPARKYAFSALEKYVSLRVSFSEAMS